MRKRKLLLVLAGLAVLAVGALVLWPKPEAERIKREKFERIREGMSRADVEAILGPPGDYTSAPVRPLNDYTESAFGPPVATRPGGNWYDQGTYANWETDAATVLVHFSGVGRVDFAIYYRNWLADDQSALAHLLWRAKRQWHRWFPEK
jgi:hypothetical protein